MTLRLKTMFQMDEKNYERNCTILRSFLEGKSYHELARAIGVTFPTVATSTQRLVHTLAIFAQEMGFVHPYTEEKYPHLWRDRIEGNERVKYAVFSTMNAPDLRAEKAYWVHLLDVYTRWKDEPAKINAVEETTPLYYLDLSTTAFRNIGQALRYEAGGREPLVSDLLAVMRMYAKWSMRCQIHTGIGQKAHADIKEELERHGFKLIPPEVLSDRELFREALAYVRQPRQFNRTEQDLLIRRLSERVSGK